jgi:hypothetical protein
MAMRSLTLFRTPQKDIQSLLAIPHGILAVVSVSGFKRTRKPAFAVNAVNRTPK